MWSSAAVVHLLQVSVCCAFRDGILHTLVAEVESNELHLLALL